METTVMNVAVSHGIWASAGGISFGLYYESMKTR